MTRLTIGFLIIALAAGCTALDFFSYREDTGLKTIGRPNGYDSTNFGHEMAATSNGEMDLFAASAGLGFATIFYQVSSDGALVDSTDKWHEHPYEEEDGPTAGELGSGAALAGLPTWGAAQSGCLAIGEPTAAQVAISCEPTPEKEDYLTGGELFGHALAAIRPDEGEPWLLAAAQKSDFAVISGFRATGPTRERTDFHAPREASGVRIGNITELAAGRLTVSGENASRFFVAAGIVDESTQRYQVYLFLQSFPGAQSLDQLACLQRMGEAGFGAVMATGDLDGDGNDELVVSAGLGERRKDVVYVYSTLDIFNDAIATGAVHCNGSEPEPVAEVVPGEGTLDVTCPEDGCFFGAALAVGDIATDDEGDELIVGAPMAKTDGKKDGGAVYLFRGPNLMTGAPPYPVAGQVADSSPRKGHRFGGGLTVAPMAGRNELIVAATGKGTLYIAYCTGVGEDITIGADVTHNSGGTVVSTRCRP